MSCLRTCVVVKTEVRIGGSGQGVRKPGGSQLRPVHTDVSRAGVSRPVSPQGPSGSTDHIGSQTGGGRGEDQGPALRYVWCVRPQPSHRARPCQTRRRGGESHSVQRHSEPRLRYSRFPEARREFEKGEERRTLPSRSLSPGPWRPYYCAERV